MVALIKPQFEAGRDRVGKHGIVRDPAVHCDVIQHVMALATAAGFNVCHLDFSPITGGHGNIEFLVDLQATENAATIDPALDPAAVVKQAHATLK